MTNEEFDKSQYIPPVGKDIQRWLREQHDIHMYVYRECVGSDEFEYVFAIDWLPIQFENYKRTASLREYYVSYKDGIGSYSGTFNTWELAYEAAINYAMNVVLPKQFENNETKR